MDDDLFNIHAEDMDPRILFLGHEQGPQPESFRDCGRCFLVSRSDRFNTYVTKAAGEMALEPADAAHVIIERFHGSRHDLWELEMPRVYVATDSELCNAAGDDNHVRLHKDTHDLFSGHFELSLSKDLSLGLHLDMMGFNTHLLESVLVALIERGHSDIAGLLVGAIADADRFGWHDDIDSSPFAHIAPTLMKVTRRRIYKDLGAEGVLKSTAGLMIDYNTDVSNLNQWIIDARPSIEEIHTQLTGLIATFGKGLVGLEEEIEEEQAKTLNKKIRARKKTRKETGEK